MSSPRLLLLPLLLLALSSRAAVVAHYPFDTDFRDVSLNARHGTLVDTNTPGNTVITATPGDWKFGDGALFLSADRDYVSIPSRTFGSGTAYSIGFWARKSAGDTGDAAQWDMAIGSVDTTNFYIGLNNGTGLRWRGADTSAGRNADFNAPNDTAWHHHLLAATTTGNLAYYLDGTLVTNLTGKSTGFTLNAIGEAYTTALDYDFNGWIDEVWIFDHTLTATEAANLAQVNHPSGMPAAPWLLLHLPFDDDFADASPSANHGAAAGAAALDTNPADVSVGTGALTLDGADASMVTLAAPIALNSSQPWTSAFWARRGETTAGKGMVMGERNTTDDFIWFNDNYNGLRFRSSTSVTLDFTVTRDLAYHHYALVADGLGALALYVDGAFAQVLYGNTSLRVDTIGLAYTTASHYSFRGELDDVRLYDGALIEAEVQALFALGDGGGSSTPVTAVRVYLQGGQSNGDGRGATASLPTSPVNLQQPQAGFDYVYRVQGGSTTLSTLRPGTSETGQFGPEVTFAPELARWRPAPTGTRIAVLKYANGGTNLHTQWRAGGDATTTGDGSEYITFQQTVTAGLATLAVKYPGAALTVEAMTWMQGESDEGAADDYAANLTAFIADVRATYGAELPFVIARLSSGQTAIAPGPLATLRSAQQVVAEADPLSAWVNTDAYTMQVDHLHFDGFGQQALGRDFAYQAAYRLWVRESFSPAQRLAGEGEPYADPDGDGAANANEFTAATAPLDPASRLAAALEAGISTLTLQHATVTGLIYSVQSRATPADAWAPALPALPGTGLPLVRPLPVSGEGGQFRVIAERP